MPLTPLHLAAAFIGIVLFLGNKVRATASRQPAFVATRSSRFASRRFPLQSGAMEPFDNVSDQIPDGDTFPAPLLSAKWGRR